MPSGEMLNKTSKILSNMTSKLTLRSLLFALLAMGLFSVAKADIYIYCNQDTHSVGKIVDAQGMVEADIYPNAPVEAWWITDPYGTPMLHADIDATVATGTYYIGVVHDGAWVDIEDVYVVIQ